MPTLQYRIVLFDQEALVADGTITSPVVDLKWVTAISGLTLRAVAAAGNADVRVEMQSSRDNSNWDSADDRADVLSSSQTSYANNIEGWNVVGVTDPGNRYIRFLVDELGTLATVVDMELLCEEEIP